MIRETCSLICVLGLMSLLWACGPDCEGIKDRARAMVEEATQCSAEQDCVTVSMYELAGGNNCLLNFQCHKAFGGDVDLDAFEKEAKDLVESFRSCGECVSAGCVSPEVEELQPQCNEATGLCELQSTVVHQID